MGDAFREEDTDELEIVEGLRWGWVLCSVGGWLPFLDEVLQLVLSMNCVCL